MRKLNYLIFITIFLLVSCGDKNSEEKKYFEILEKDEKIISVKMFDDKIYNVPLQPKRVVVLYNSLLEPWKLCGGNITGRVVARNSLAKWAEKIPVMGNMGSPNIEVIMQKEPELVVIADNIRGQNKIKSFLQQNNIPVLPINYATYFDFLDILKLFSIINESEKEIKPVIAGLKNKINLTVDRLKNNRNLKALILFASTKNISCELPGGDTGTLLQILGIENVIKYSPINNSRRVEFSLEKIVELDPDIIFVKTMGDTDKIKSRLGKELINNNAWKKLNAVKNNKVYFLPKEMFMFKANFKYPDAIEYLAEKINN
ncbi:MAG: ABC transporter substrate-binding protein [Rhodothermaceae bacterium]